jgi:hypothetical protein
MARISDYIPRTDADFNLWQANFVGKVTLTPADYGLTPAEVMDLAADAAAWTTALNALILTQNATRGAAETKDDTRDTLESEIRTLTNRIQSWKDITNAKREELDITVRKTTRTPLSDQIVLVTPPPVIQAKCTGPKTVRIDWYPTQAPGESEALPQGIDGVNIWVAEGGIPSDDSQWRFLAMDTNSPYIHSVGNESTMTLAYKAQWFDRRKRMGPFCDPVLVAVTP